MDPSLLVILPDFIEMCTDIASQDRISAAYCLIPYCICTTAAANRSSSDGISSGGGDVSSRSSSSSIFNNDKFTKIPGIRHSYKTVNIHANCHQLS
jgi:hypothetical protein